MCSTTIVSYNVTIISHFIISKRLCAYMTGSSVAKRSQFCSIKQHWFWSSNLLVKQLLSFLLQITYKHVAKNQQKKVEQENVERKNRTCPHAQYIGHTISIIIYRAHACQYNPFKVIVSSPSNINNSSTRLYPSGTNARALNGSRCHNDSCTETKFEKSQPEPFCSYTSMKFYS